MAGKIKILYVDDEENNLISFRSYFRKEFEIYTALSVTEATTLLAQKEVQIIISDHRMPSSTGVEFLEKTIKSHPDCIRMLITGQADLHVVIEAINRGQITKFVQKPWDWEKLSLTIENCVLLYRSRAEIKQKNNELQKANNELNKFVYSLSHDLRSPLMSILGIVHLARTNKDEFEKLDSLSLIENSIIKLDGFIKNIINYHKNSQGEQVSQNINFKELAESVVESLNKQDYGINIHTEVNQQQDFFCDSLRLKIILSNLVSNAIKYQNSSAANRFVKITINVANDTALISVSDNGIGIQQKHLENIFKLFFRIENLQEKEGTGIGLYIVKEALEKIGGKITVVSKPMQGTSFDITIQNKEPTTT